MPVPSVITDLSTVAASNSPAGSDAVFPDLDNYIRALSAFIAQNYTLKANLASPTFTGTVTLADAAASGTITSPNFFVGSLTSSSGAFGVGGGNGSYIAAYGTAASGTGDMDFATAGGVRVRLKNAGHLIPVANNAYLLGDTGTRWSNFYSVLGNFSGAVSVDSLSATTQPGFCAYRSSDVTSVSGTIVFDTEAFDTASNYNNGTGIFTVPAGHSGRYLVSASVTVSHVGTSGDFYIIATPSSGQTLYSQPTSMAAGNRATASITHVLNLTAGDTVLISTATTAGTSDLLYRPLGAGAARGAWFSIEKLN